MKKGGEQMNENYLLHNETAKKLYFEYARNLPIIALCENFEADDKIYSNIAEAFLTNDCYKLDAMRVAGVEEKYISGNASDYEKFKEFCRVFPKFAGHPLYLLSHIELKKHFGCEYVICEENCDSIWNDVNQIISTNLLTEKALLNNTNIEIYNAFTYYWIQEIKTNYNITDFNTLENELKNKMLISKEFGCNIVLYDPLPEFVKPNPYFANEIVKRIKYDDKSLEFDDLALLDAQIVRVIAEECKKHDCTFLTRVSCFNDDLSNYLKECNLLPKVKQYLAYSIGDSEDYLELQLRGYARNNPIGQMISTIGNFDKALSYPKHDYFRRVICNIIGKWVENGEYTSDENTLKKLIEDILYNNLKEAIS